ncbi:DUF7002 family protein [Chloroflexota bacterium]
MQIEQLIQNYPILYHMAASGSWPSIKQHGLLSTTALLDLFEYTGERRLEIESRWRPNSVKIENPVYGTAVVRDQRPMPPDKITPLLRGIGLQEWYELLNGKTFFWVSRHRLDTLLNAYAYRNKSHCILFVDTKKLLDAYADIITLTNINTGFAHYGGPRGRDTFKSIKDFTANRGVWELAVDYDVKHILDLVLRVEERKRDQRISTIWTKDH